MAEKCETKEKSILSFAITDDTQEVCAPPKSPHPQHLDSTRPIIDIEMRESRTRVSIEIAHGQLSLSICGLTICSGSFAHLQPHLGYSRAPNRPELTARLTAEGHAGFVCSVCSAQPPFAMQTIHHRPLRKFGGLVLPAHVFPSVPNKKRQLWA